MLIGIIALNDLIFTPLLYQSLDSITISFLVKPVQRLMSDS